MWRFSYSCLCALLVIVLYFVLFKQKTAYEVRISDWSSDVCSSDLRVEGVGNVQVFASPYAMRVWLDPQKLANYRLSAAEALAAVQEQNSQSRSEERRVGEECVSTCRYRW